MFKFLLLLALFIFIIGFSTVWRSLRKIFGPTPQSRQQTKQSTTNQKKRQPTAPTASKKLIASDEGEYVDYVEIKD